MQQIIANDTGNTEPITIDSLSGWYRTPSHALMHVLKGGNIVIGDEISKIKKVKGKIIFNDLTLVAKTEESIEWVDESNTQVVWMSESRISELISSSQNVEQNSLHAMHVDAPSPSKRPQESPIPQGTRKRTFATLSADQNTEEDLIESPKLKLSNSVKSSPNATSFTSNSIPVYSPIESRPPCSNKVLAAVQFNQLTDSDFIVNHLNGIHNLCQDMNVMQGDEPHPHLKTQFLNKVIATFNNHYKGIAEFCARVIQGQCGYSWVKLRHMLKQKYASPELLENSYNRRLGKLKLIVTDYEEFITDVSALLALLQQIYPNDQGQRRHVIRNCINKIPEPYRTMIIMQLKLATPDRTDWEMLPFDHGDSTNISDTVRLILNSARPEEIRGSSSSDRARYVNDQAGSQDSNKSNLRDWVKQFPFAAHVRGQHLKKEDLIVNKLTKAGFQKSNIRFKLNFRGKPFAIVVSKDSDVVEKVKNALGSNQTMETTVVQQYDPDWKPTVPKSKN